MPDTSLRDALARVLTDELPITQSLGITVREAGSDRVMLAMPLAVNRNHKGTVFAGSLNAVATLAGWGVCWLVLRERGIDAHAVIQDAAVKYLAPARSDVTAEAARPDSAMTDRVLAMLARRGLARVALEAVVRDTDGHIVATLHGRYVMQRREG